VRFEEIVVPRRPTLLECLGECVLTVLKGLLHVVTIALMLLAAVLVVHIATGGLGTTPQIAAIALAALVLLFVVGHGK
jgi:hypothetical protein